MDLLISLVTARRIYKWQVYGNGNNYVCKWVSSGMMFKVFIDQKNAK